MGAGQALHFGQHEAQVLGVDALFACGHKATIGRALQGGLLQGLIHDLVPVVLQSGHLDACAVGQRCGFMRAAGPEFLGVGQQLVQRRLRLGVGRVGAVAHAHQPVARVAQVVAHFLERLGGNRGQLRVFGVLQLVPRQHHQAAVQEVAHDGHGKVAVTLGCGRHQRHVRQFAQGVVLEVGHVAEVRQCVLGGTAALQLGRVLVKHAGLADQVQAVVGQGDVFFKDGAVSAPFGIALSEDQRVVGQVQQVIDGGIHGRAHMWPTSSGIS